MKDTILFTYLKNESIKIVNHYGYSESLLEDDDYLHDFLHDFKPMFKHPELEVLMAYNTIFQYKIANQI